MIRPGGHFIQSHWGFMAQPIPRDGQLRAVHAAGFDHIQTIDNQNTATFSYLQPLAFIATKAR